MRNIFSDKINFRLLQLFFLGGISSLSLSQNLPAQTAFFPRYQEKIVILPGDTLLQLKHYFIVPATDSLFVKGGRLQRETDYVPDYRMGKIHLKYKPALPETLTVIYRASPVNLPPVYRAYPFIPWIEKKTDSTGAALSNRSGRTEGRDFFTESRLRKSGSLTRSLSLGNKQGLRLDSGLRLQLEGNITPDVQVVAALSDQNTPIQPEGNTQTLQEIDKVYIRIKSPVFQATLGDFDIGYHNGRFGNYQRKLQGAQLSLNRGSFRASISGAVSKGKFYTMKFTGEEGKQGPYQLRGERGETEIIILAGTERVWIDGELMVRGEENDYVIEYSSGQITFTRKRLITGDSRIEIDFEYSDMKFQRNLYSAHFSGSNRREKLKYSATFIREADDKNNPLEADLSDAEKQVLAQAGDNIETAYSESGTYVGAGKGNYIQIDSLAAKLFRYVGAGKGDYQVRFSYIGDKGGDYRYVGRGRYEFVGNGRGNYSPKRFLPVAQSQSLAAFSVAAAPVPAVTISGEMALSQMDLNRFSDKDDDDNLGGAYQFKTSFQPKSFAIGNKNLGNIQLTGLIRHQDSRFYEITRNREVEYSRIWDIQNDPQRGEKIRRLDGSYTPWRHVRIAAEVGNFHSGNLFESAREMAEFSLNRAKLPEILYREEHIRKNNGRVQIRGNWLRRLGKIQYKWWRFRPHLRYEAEDKRDRTYGDSLHNGFAFQDISAGMGFRLAKPLELSFTQTERRDKISAKNNLRDNSKASSQIFTVRLSRWKNLQANFSLTNRVRKYSDEKQPEKRTRLGDVNISYSPLQRALQSSLRMQMSTTQLSKTEQIYFKVEEGRGNYRFDADLNEYIPDPFGEYILRTFVTGEFEPVNDLLINGKLNFKPKLFYKRQKKYRNRLKKILRNFAWETYFSMNEKSRRANPWALNFGLDGLIFPDEETVFGRYLVRQDLYFFEDVVNRSLRFRWMENYEKNNRLTEGGQYSLRQEQSLRFIARFSKKFSSQTNLFQRRIDRIFSSAVRTDRLILSRGLDTRMSYRPKSSLEIAAEFKYQKDMDRVYAPNTRTRLISIKPNFNYAIRGRGRLRGELEYADVSASPENRIIPYEMANGRRVGKNFRWQIGLDYRLSAKLMIIISYLGRREPGRDEIQHLGKAELKAYF